MKGFRQIILVASAIFTQSAYAEFCDAEMTSRQGRVIDEFSGYGHNMARACSKALEKCEDALDDIQSRGRRAGAYCTVPEDDIILRPGRSGSDNSCNYANDGVCDDGRPGARYSLCSYGTDENDCSHLGGRDDRDDRIGDGDRHIPTPRYDWGPVKTKTYSINECIGDGETCSRSTATIYLPDEVKVEEISFYAHDSVGSRSRAKLNISVDGQSVASWLNIKSGGSNHYIDGRGKIGDSITFNPSRDDVFIEDVTVKFRRNRNR